MYNGGKYCNKRLLNVIQCAVSTHQTTNPYMPQQNGKAEWFNRTIMDKARNKLLESGLLNNFCAEAVDTATYFFNRSILQVGLLTKHRRKCSLARSPI